MFIFFGDHAVWDNRSRSGNPTKSKKLNDLIDGVIKQEIRGLGPDSKADRAFTMSEFKCILNIIDWPKHRAMMILQFHLIARMDDMCHMKKIVLKHSGEFPGYLTGRVRWSKNVFDHHDCPEQILLPSMDPSTCVHLSLALWLEEWIEEKGGGMSIWLFNTGVATHQSNLDDLEEEVESAKKQYSGVLKSAIESPFFERDERADREADGKKPSLGSHSIRKLGATFARRAGATKDDLDYRGRWKCKRMQDHYVDMHLTWPDVNTAAKLCNGGICFYKLKPDFNVTEDWLSRLVTPNISKVFGAGV